MLPVALAIAGEYESYTNENDADSRLSSDRLLHLKKGLILCVAYGSIYGGLSTIVGSAATIFLEGFVDEYDSSSFERFRIEKFALDTFRIQIFVLLFLIICC